MFLGTYYHKIEAKGRVSLPKKFREQAKTWVLTRGIDGGLLLFPREEFAHRLATSAGRTLTKKHHRDYVRLLLNQAVEITPDRVGRIQIPEFLLHTASLKKEVVMVGSYAYAEIWDREQYHQYLDEVSPQLATIAEGLEEYEI